MKSRFPESSTTAFPRSARLLACIALPAILAVACSVPEQHHNYEDASGPEKRVFLQRETVLPTVGDPSEPFNRSMSGVNHGLIYGIINPLSTGWGWITGHGVRESVGNFFHNLRWPLHLFGNLLQGEWNGAWRETERFCINITVGILGFFDPATKWGIAAAEEDFGRAFASWGWTHSNYLVIPFFGPKTSRDALALPFDLAFNPVTYIPGGFTVEMVNAGTDKLDAYFRFVKSNYDPYHRGRLLYLLSREWRSVSYEAVPARDRSVETLGAIHLSNKDLKFPRGAETRAVSVPESGHDLAYDLWLQPAPAPVVCILPGLGGHRISSSAYGLAEMVWRAGYSAITISNAMNWDFVQNGASVDVPGFAPQDAKDVHRVLGLILADVEKAYPGRVTKKALLGISLGAFHTLFIAATEETDRTTYPEFDAYAAINPPVRFEVGMKHLDAFYNAPTSLPEGEERPWVDALLGKVVDLVDKGQIEQGNLLPFTKMEAEFLIGLAFRATLTEFLISSQDRKDMGILKTERSDWRTANAYIEARDYSYREYMLAFALPYYQARDPSILGVADMLGRCDIRRFGDRLKANEKVFVFTNVNDFLLEEEDLRWLQATFPEHRLATETTGSHLGNLYEPAVQERILKQLSTTLSR